MPGLHVSSSRPLPTVPEQDEIPGPPAPSWQLYAASTFWPSAYLAPLFGVARVTNGALATVYEIDLVPVWPSEETAVTV